MKRIVRTMAVVAAVLVASTSVGAHAASAAAALDPPALTATFLKKELRLTWTFGSGVAGRVVEIERSLDHGPFAPLTTARATAKRGTYTDKQVTTRDAAYRARVAGTQTWSAVVETDAFPPLSAGIGECPSDDIARGIAALNAWRANPGSITPSAPADVARGPVHEEIRLARVARYRVNRLVTSGRYAHPPGFAGNLRAWGYTVFGHAAENIIAIGNAEQAITGWAGSAGHRTNMLLQTTEVGWACAVGRDGHAYHLLIMGSFILASPGFGSS